MRTDLTIVAKPLGFEDGLLNDLIAALRSLPDGSTVAIEGRVDRDEIERWSQLTGHPLLEATDRRVVLRKGGLAPMADDARDAASRLWIYTNFDCNLACDYCCVRSGPRAEKRRLGPATIRERAEEARSLGFGDVFLTGGEPLLHPQLAEIAGAAAELLPTTILTNAMLIAGPRLDALAALPRDRVALQVSLDSPTPELHDRHRGAGSWARARQGVRAARDRGFRVRIAATVTTREQHEAMDAFLEVEGIPPRDRVIRPLARRGNATTGMLLARAELVPELTLTAEGWYWHPVGATDDDFLVTREDVPLRRALELARSRQREDRAHAERAAEAFRCA